MPDRDVTRFFWFKNPNLPLSDDNTQIYRFKRVPFGVVSSPFLLGATIRHHLSSKDTPLAAQIRDSMYVDNLITGTDAPDQAMKTYKEVKSIFSKASMNIRQWTTNTDTNTAATIPLPDRATGELHSVLGVMWNTETRIHSTCQHRNVHRRYAHAEMLSAR